MIAASPVLPPYQFMYVDIRLECTMRLTQMAELSLFSTLKMASSSSLLKCPSDVCVEALPVVGVLLGVPARRLAVALFAVLLARSSLRGAASIAHAETVQARPLRYE